MLMLDHSATFITIVLNIMTNKRFAQPGTRGQRLPVGP